MSPMIPIVLKAEEVQQLIDIVADSKQPFAPALLQKIFEATDNWGGR